jgi:hypothetical protein
MFHRSAVQNWTPTLAQIFGTASPRLKSLDSTLLGVAGEAAPVVLRKIVEVVSQHLEPLMTAVMQAAQPAVQAGSALFIDPFIPTLEGLLEELRGGGPTSEEQLYPRMFELFRRAAAAGVQAHLLSCLGGIDVLGCGFDFGPISVFLADLGDYGRIIDPYIDAHVDAKIGRPARHAANRAFRPTHPSVGELDDWFLRGFIGLTPYQRLLQEEGLSEEFITAHIQALTHAPDDRYVHDMYVRQLIDKDTWEKQMRRRGVSQDWLERLRKVLFTPPPARQLADYLASPVADDGWLYRKLQDSGLSDGDAAIAVDAYLNRANKPYTDRIFSELYSMRRKGYIEAGTFFDALSQLNLRPEQGGIVQEASYWGRQHTMTDGLVQALQLGFDREFVSLETMLAALEVAGLDEFERLRIAAVAAIKKYNRITWKRPEEQQAAFDAEVRKAIPKYLTAYKCGQMTTSDLQTLLETSGLLPEVADLTLLLAKQARLAEFGRQAKALGLPDKRELYIMGFLSEDAYRTYLQGRGLPPQVVEVELAVAKAKRDERIGARVSSQLVPAYEAGYVYGLVTADELASAWDVAGLDERAQALKLGVLEAKRRAAESGMMSREDILAWVRGVANYTVTESDFLDELAQYDVLLPIQEAALALVPVMRNITRTPVFTDADLATLMAAMSVGLLNRNDVMLNWLAPGRQRRQFAAAMKAASEPRTGAEFGMPPTPAQTEK